MEYQIGATYSPDGGVTVQFAAPVNSASDSSTCFLQVAWGWAEWMCIVVKNISCDSQFTHVGFWLVHACTVLYLLAQNSYIYIATEL